MNTVTDPGDYYHSICYNYTLYSLACISNTTPNVIRAIEML